MTDAKKPEGAEAPVQKEQQPKEQAADLLEADDLFEEFGNEEWQCPKDDGDEEVPLWEADWEDENVSDDFTARLRAELEQRGMKE